MKKKLSLVTLNKNQQREVKAGAEAGSCGEGAYGGPCSCYNGGAGCNWFCVNGQGSTPPYAGCPRPAA